MLRGNIRLYLRAWQNVFEKIKMVYLGYKITNPIFGNAQQQMIDKMLPQQPVKVLIKDLNKIDLKYYTYSSAQNLLKKRTISL